MLEIMAVTGENARIKGCDWENVRLKAVTGINARVNGCDWEKC